MKKIELLSPAGSPEAGYAALEYGADAVYLGLSEFSARAGADNFTINDLRPFVNYAHQVDTPRAVYVAINTLLQDAEIPRVIDDLVVLDEIGVDAVIVQDLGVVRLIREHFPHLELHASTQMAIHSRAGAQAMSQLGIRRVVLARELTIEEITGLSGIDGLETEVFIHGALCYAYSGLCLMSSHFRHLSGNRGKCSYTCREAFQESNHSADGFVLSMRDLALPDHLKALKDAGVSSLKIEGRKKSPTYVAAVTHYYRRLLDGTLQEDERTALESDIRTIFSRPQTELFASSRFQKGSARSTDVKTHQGALTGSVTAFIKGQGVPDRIVVDLTDRELEKFDGLQVSVPGEKLPFGFAAKAIWPMDQYDQGPPMLRAEKGDQVEIELPDHHPRIFLGTEVFCSLAGAVKNRFKTTLPRVETFTGHIGVDIKLTITESALSATLSTMVHGTDILVEETEAFDEKPEQARRDLSDSARRAFEKFSNTPFKLASFAIDNPLNLYVTQSRLNQLRRQLLSRAEASIEEERLARRERILSASSATVAGCEMPGEQWAIAVDNPSYLDAFSEKGLSEVSEVILNIGSLDSSAIKTFMERFADILPVRLGLPVITRDFEALQLESKINHLLEAGATRWALSNLSGMTYLKDKWDTLDVLADWPLYVLNNTAVDELMSLGFSSVTLSPEDTGQNVKQMLACGQDASVIVFQDTPLAISEACIMATDTCRQEACDFRETKLTSKRDTMLAINQNCRTVLINEIPYSLCDHLTSLRENGARHFRADFIWRDYTPEEVYITWKQLRAETFAATTHSGSYGRRI